MKTLRKIMMALFAIACIGMTVSCNKEDNNDNGGGNSALVGTWKISSILVNGDDWTQNMPGEIQVTLNASGSGTIAIFGRNENFTWTATSSTLTVTTPGNDVVNCNIASLTSTSCTLTSHNMTFPVVGDIEGEVTITLTKVGGGDNPGPDNNYSNLIVGTWQVTQTIVNGQDVTAQSGDVKLSFTANGQGLLNHNGETENNDFGWSISGNTITITPHGDAPATFTIVSLDGQTCTFTGSRMPGVEQDLGEVRITMVKINNPNPDPNPDPDPDPDPTPIATLVGTNWAYNFSYSDSRTVEGATYEASISIDITLSFTTATQGTATETEAMQVSINGVPNPEMSETDSETNPFTYTFNEASQSGTITITTTHEEDGETFTETNTLTFTATQGALTVVNPDPDPEGTMPSTLVFTRR